MTLFSDQEIIRALQEGPVSKQNEVISYLYKKCYRQVLGFILKNGGQNTDCEDIFQQAMEVFYYQIQRDKFRGNSSIVTYFHGIAKNLWFTALRKRKHAHLEITAEAELIEEETSSIENQLPLFYNLFEQLEDDCQRILKYVYYDHLSMREIISKFTSLTTEQSVRAKKYRCLKYLTNIFKKNKIDQSQFI